ncbi:MAG: aldo/keto reductase [Planctomycetota bacterium]|nr:aldo/keto reductase [Planctomycetota bacterium]
MPIERRELGKTGRLLSAIGFGGIAVMNESPEFAADLVAEAIERGINYFDVAPSYGDAELKLGPALEPYRSDVFLACKTTKRDANGARLELDQSLKNLKTDHFDLYQFHAVTTMEDVDAIFSNGGAMETFLEAREKGQTHLIGFSAHSEEAAIAMLDRFAFDSVLFPLNNVAWYQGNFGPRVVKKAKELGTGLLALKGLAKRKWKEGEERTWPNCWYKPVESLEDAEQALGFTLSLPVTAAVTPGHAELVRLACDAAERLFEKGNQPLPVYSELLEVEPVFSS